MIIIYRAIVLLQSINQSSCNRRIINQNWYDVEPQITKVHIFLLKKARIKAFIRMHDMRTNSNCLYCLSPFGKEYNSKVFYHCTFFGEIRFQKIFYLNFVA